MVKIDKVVHVVAPHERLAPMEIYLPNCEVSKIVSDLKRSSQKKNLVFEDLLTLRNAGWEIHYKGKRSNKLPLIDAIYDGDLEEKK